MGSAISYKKRALLDDILCIQEANKILALDDRGLNESFPKPLPDITAKNEIMFIEHREVKPHVALQLNAKHWQYTLKNIDGHIATTYTHSRSYDYSNALQVVVFGMEVSLWAVIVMCFISYQILFKMYGYTWFTKDHRVFQSVFFSML